MTIPEIESCLNKMTILYDTREQVTAMLRKRLAEMPCETRREKLDSGDYSVETVLTDGTIYSLKAKFAIERKMSLGEICGNFCRGRDRFRKEFNRFRDGGGKLCIVIENASIDGLRSHRYNSQMSPSALMASLSAWYAEFDSPFYFCDKKDSGYLIYHILKYQLREHLKREFGNNAKE
jgi:ERCC4-type nuclease